MTNNTIQQVIDKLTTIELWVGSGHPAFAKAGEAITMLKDMQQVDVLAAVEAGHKRYWSDSRLQEEAYRQWISGTQSDGGCPQHCKGSIIDYITREVCAALGLTTKQEAE